MIAAIALGPTQQFVLYVQRACAEIEDLYIYKTLYKYATGYELSQVLSVFTPQVVFLEIASAEAALEVIKEIRTYQPTTAIVGFAQQSDPRNLGELREAGLGEVVLYPFSGEDLHQAIVGTLKRQGLGFAENLFVFLPAKAGSGATTVALNTAGFLVQECKRKVLLIEADLHSGTLSMLLNVSSEQSIIDALENVHWLNDETWNRLHTRALGIDILTAPSAVKAAKLVEWNCQRLLTFVRSRYDTVIVDLPDVISDATASIITQAKAVYLVCTPEMPSLFLAQRRIQELHARGVWNSRLCIAVTRHTHREPKIEALEKILQGQVAVVFPNDYFGVREATQAAKLVDGDSKLGNAFSSFARTLSRKEPGTAKDASWGFLFRKLAVKHS